MQEMQETWVQSLGQEDPLEEGRATHSSILAWRIPWTEEPDGLQSTGRTKLDTTEATYYQCKNKDNIFYCDFLVTFPKSPLPDQQTTMGSGASDQNPKKELYLQQP